MFDRCYHFFGFYVHVYVLLDFLGGCVIVEAIIIVFVPTDLGEDKCNGAVF